MNKILIFGGLGYLGSTLVPYLLKNTDFDITVIDCDLYDNISNFLSLTDIHKDRFRIIVEDIRKCDFSTILKDIDFVINLAALVGPISDKYPDDAQSINYDANTKLYLALANINPTDNNPTDNNPTDNNPTDNNPTDNNPKQSLGNKSLSLGNKSLSLGNKSGIKRFIFASTCSNYGYSDDDLLLNESSELKPISLYSKTKVESEKLLLKGIIPVVILRFATAFGVNGRTRYDLMVHEFTKSAYYDGKIELMNENHYRPFVHVMDIAKVITLIIQQNDQIGFKEVFNIGTNDNNITKLQLAKLIQKHTDCKIVKLNKCSDLRNYKVDFTKMKNILNYEPTYSIEDCIKNLVWLFSNNLVPNLDFYQKTNNRTLKKLNINSPTKNKPPKGDNSRGNNIMYLKPSFNEKEALACYDYLNSGGYVTEFKQTRKLESMICDFVGSSHCFMVNNGTISLVIALLALDLTHGDEVIIPNLTMIATADAAKLIGCSIKLIDVDPSSLTINLDSVKNAVTDKTKAIIHVSLNGRSDGIDLIREFCDEKNIYLIEDAAQSLGSKYKNKYIGTYGHIGSYSFSPQKIISTGQGGALVTNDETLANKIKMIKDFGRRGGGNHNFEIFGINSKFTDIQSVIGIEQMKKINVLIDKKKLVYQQYKEKLNGLVSMISSDDDGWVPWVVDIYVNNPKELATYLKNNGVPSAFQYPTINSFDFLKIGSMESFENSYKASKTGLWLPCMSNIETNDIDFICNHIKSFYNK